MKKVETNFFMFIKMLYIIQFSHTLDKNLCAAALRFYLSKFQKKEYKIIADTVTSGVLQLRSEEFNSYTVVCGINKEYFSTLIGEYTTESEARDVIMIYPILIYDRKFTRFITKSCPQLMIVINAVSAATYSEGYEFTNKYYEIKHVPTETHQYVLSEPVVVTRV